MMRPIRSCQAGIAGNAAPDLVLLNVEAARNLDSKSLLADLQSMIDADSEFQKDNYLSVFYDQGVDDANVVFGLPAYGTTQVMYYNKAAFEEAGTMQMISRPGQIWQMPHRRSKQPAITSMAGSQCGVQIT